MVLPKVGVIPIGRRRRRQLPGIVSVGEAGLVQPPLLGTAFNEILEHCKAVCSHLSHSLRDTSGIPMRPNYRYPLLKRTQDHLQLQITRVILNGNVEVFDRLIRFMSKLPSKTVYNLCSNELTWKQMMGAIIRLPLI